MAKTSAKLKEEKSPEARMGEFWQTQIEDAGKGSPAFQPDVEHTYAGWPIPA